MTMDVDSYSLSFPTVEDAPCQRRILGYASGIGVGFIVADHLKGEIRIVDGSEFIQGTECDKVVISNGRWIHGMVKRGCAVQTEGTGILPVRMR